MCTLCLSSSDPASKIFHKIKFIWQAQLQLKLVVTNAHGPIFGTYYLNLPPQLFVDFCGSILTGDISNYIFLSTECSQPLKKKKVTHSFVKKVWSWRRRNLEVSFNLFKSIKFMLFLRMFYYRIVKKRLNNEFQ